MSPELPLQAGSGGGPPRWVWATCLVLTVAALGLAAYANLRLYVVEAHLHSSIKELRSEIRSIQK